MNAKQWEEFLQVDAQRRNNYRQFLYDDGYSTNPPPFVGNNVPMDAEGKYPHHVKN